MRCFYIVMGGTLLTPILISPGEGMWPGKIIPSIFSATAAGCTAWLQLRKPQQLWAIYRTCQRKLEDHETRFLYSIEPYEDEKREQKLAENVAKIAMEAHDNWLPIVPNPENIKETLTNPLSEKQT